MSTYKYSPHQSTIGNYDANVIGLITYISPLVVSHLPHIGPVSWIVPILFFLIERNSKLVKFHSLQSASLYVIQSILLSILLPICKIIPLLGFIVSSFINLVFLLITIVMIIKVYNYEQYELPYIGKFISNLI